MQTRMHCLFKACATVTKPQQVRLLAAYWPSTSDDDTEESALDVDSSDNRKRSNIARASVVALQHLYSDFLPPHLQLNQYTYQAKQQKINNRPAVYTKDSWTMQWRKDSALKKAAQGCATLDGFIQRKVC